jgi:hypothetical protein
MRRLITSQDYGRWKSFFSKKMYTGLQQGSLLDLYHIKDLGSSLQRVPDELCRLSLVTVLCEPLPGYVQVSMGVEGLQYPEG